MVRTTYISYINACMVYICMSICVYISILLYECVYVDIYTHISQLKCYLIADIFLCLKGCL